MKRKRRIALIVLAALLLTPHFVSAYTVAGPSMSPTLWLGDRVLSSNVAYDLRLPFSNRLLLRIGDPRRGDVVVYHDRVKKAVAIKRIVAVPGDTIEMRENRLWINGIEHALDLLDRHDFDVVPLANALGEQVAEEHGSDTSHLVTFTPGRSEKRSFVAQKIPPERYFLLGDHRDNSADSRFIGLIHRDQVMGRIVYGTREKHDY